MCSWALPAFAAKLIFAQVLPSRFCYSQLRNLHGTMFEHVQTVVSSKRTFTMGATA